ncbi:MAG: TrkH family potassium uptake protein [Oscillospiraceae bacterium]
MNYRILTKVLNRVLLIEAVLLLAPLITALVYGESILPFLWAILLILAASALLYFPARKADGSLHAREGFVSVALSWIVLSLFGALPFVFSGALPNYIDAVFETVSGFTTTGASVISDIESMPHSILFWRSFSHFIGGMGVLVFMMAVLPMDDEHSMHLLRAEVPGPVKGKLVPQMRRTARILYLIYIGLVLTETVLLLCGGLSLFDSLLTAFGTIATGGFSPRNASIGAYDSAYVDMVVSVFMVLAGFNFNLYYIALMKRSVKGFKSEELFWYLGIILFATVSIAFCIARSLGGILPGLRYAFFQVASIMTSTGFATADFDLWPAYARTLIVLLMITGACAGSTGGGIKVSRLVITVKASLAEIRHQLFPRSVNRCALDGERLDNAVVHNTLSYCMLYALIAMASCLALSLQGFDLETAFTSVISCLSNIGPGLSMVGPTQNFAFWNGGSKLLLSLCMLLGRLEIFPVIMLFNPGVWVRQRK